MPNDLKSYLKNNKQSKKTNSEQDMKNAQNIAGQLSSKSRSELSADFNAMLAKSKQNGTFNKDEMLKMLETIRHNMPHGEYERIKSVIANL